MSLAHALHFCEDMPTPDLVRACTYAEIDYADWWRRAQSALLARVPADECEKADEGGE